MRDEAITSAVTGSPRAPEGVGDRFRRSLRTVAREAAAAFARTPLEVLLGASAAVGFSTSVQWRLTSAWTPLLVTVGIALPLVYAASALHARGVVNAPVRWGISAAAVVGAALYGFFLFDLDLAAEVWRAFLLVAGAVAALLCVPLVGHHPPGRATGADYRRAATHRFAARLVTRIVIVLAYAGALWVGLALALLAVNGLFELHLGGRAWAHLASALFFLLPPWAVAAGLPALVAPLEPWGEEEERWFRRVGAFLLAPLVLVYLAIVYAYTVRVLATGEVPKNLVSPVVLGAGLLIVLATVALEPVHADEKAGGVSLLVRLASPLLFPLVLFATWAVNARVEQYGWTEFRYLRLLALLLLAAWGAAAAVQLFRRRRPPLALMAPVLALALLLAAVGPWSAVAVARRSQTTALRTLLAAAGRTGPAATPLPLPSKTYTAIVDKARYLDGNFGWATLRGVAPWLGARPEGRIRQEQMASIIGVSESGAGKVRVVRSTLPDDVGVAGLAGGTLYLFSTGPAPASPRAARERAAVAGPAVVAPPGGGHGPSVRLEPVAGRLLVLGSGGDTLVAELAPLMRALYARADSVAPADARAPNAGRPRRARDGALEQGLRPAEAVFSLLRRDGRLAGQLVLRTLELEAVPPASAAGGKGTQPGSAPAAQATSPGATPAPAGAVGDRTLRVRSAAGFVILTGSPPSSVRGPSPGQTPPARLRAHAVNRASRKVAVTLTPDVEPLFTPRDFTPPGSFTSGAEGPAVDRDGNLYAVSFARAGTIGRITPAGVGEVFLDLPAGSTGNGIRFERAGDMLVADYTGHNVLRVDMATRAVRVHAHEPRMNQPNDIAIAADDRVYASDPKWADGSGQMWRVDPDGSVTLLEAGMGTTNGIEVGPDQGTLYVNESVQRSIWAYDLSPAGAVSNKRLLIRFADFGLDGMRCDVDGNLYVARHGKGTLVKLSPAGEVLREIRLAGEKPTNVAFGGPDGRTLYVTVADRGNVEVLRVDRPGWSWELARRQAPPQRRASIHVVGIDGDAPSGAD